MLGACTNRIRLEIVQRTVISAPLSQLTQLWADKNLFVPQATHKLFLLGCCKAHLALLKDSESLEKNPCKLLHAVQISLGSRAVCLGNSEVSRHVTAKAPFFAKDSKQSAAVIWRKQLV